MRFVTKTIHAYLDYPVAIGLIAMPFLFSLGADNALAFWLSVATGVAAFGLTVLTDHHLGLIRVLPYSLHLAVDGLVGVVFVIAPFVLGFVPPLTSSCVPPRTAAMSRLPSDRDVLQLLK